ncbi:ABC transporter substrate-binding protein [Castellaniella sp.]|uniref:ABC transporter substrate-binding protein n=1 Tax=Castellaniella sp. TaxID=1955812 RepID=UPI002AFF241C|nr:ABC transporter substrate-binding protein [Castellaniella sp.]
MKFSRHFLYGCLLLAGMGISSVHAQDVVRIGVGNDRSGAYSDLGGIGSEIAVRMAVEDFGGKVLDKKIEVIGGDNQSKVDVASGMVRKWFDTENVVAFIDGGASSTGLASMHVAVEKGGSALMTAGFASIFSGKECSPRSTQWAPDTYALANAVVSNTIKNGGKTWYSITADYVFGKSLEASANQFVKDNGGQVLGNTRYPFGSTEDYASFLLQAQSSGAQVVGLASAGKDLVSLVRQAYDFGIAQSGQKLAAYLVFVTDVLGMGLTNAQGLRFATPFYWDADEGTRNWSKRWQEQTGFSHPPTMVHALGYAATTHYLKAVEAAGTFEGDAVNARMREFKIDDLLIKNAHIRPEDGRVIMDMYEVEVKDPKASTSSNDIYNIVSTISGKDLFLPLSESECPLVKQG